MEPNDLFSLICRWVHILAMASIVGGAVFMRAALMPSASAVLAAEAHEELRRRISARWRRVVHPCIVLLLLTGAYNFYVAIAHRVPPMPYHAVFGVKVLAALGVFFLAVALTGSDPGFASLRAQSKKWMNVQIALAVTVIILSGILKTLHQVALVTPDTG